MAGGEGSLHAELGFKHLPATLQARLGCHNLRHGYYYRTSLFAFPGSGALSKVKTKPFDPGARVGVPLDYAFSPPSPGTPSTVSGGKQGHWNETLLAD